MTKIALIIIAVFIFVFILVKLYCVCLFAGDFDEDFEDEHKGEDDDMLFVEKLCPMCKTGKESYDIDKHSEICPHIECLKNGKCNFFVPFN